ncbi:MAG: MFS transporter [Desulfovibrionaceae bacterium]|jgi:MFS family permease|nr:MFS transporter [Desulfovibrionaceae bacterium]
MVSSKSAILVALAVTQFAVPLMLSALVVALPAIGQEFQSTAPQMSLIESAYISSVAMCLLPLGRLSDMLGRARLYVRGLAAFALASLLVGLSQSTYVFILLRAVQGCAGAALLAACFALVADNFGPTERGRALGVIMAAIYLGVSMGPTVGGLLTANLGWRWIFYIGCATSLMALVLCVRNLPFRQEPRKPMPFDWTGALLSAGFFGLLTAGGAHAALPWGKWAMAGSIAFLIAFAAWETRCATPLLDMRLLRANRAFSLSCLTQYLFYAALFGLGFLFSLFLQVHRGISPMNAGLILGVQPVIQSLLSPPAGKLADRSSPRALAIGGILLAFLGFGLATFLDRDTGLWLIFAVMVLVGVGTALFGTSNMSVIMGSVRPLHYGMASALTGATRTAGMSLSTILIGLAFSHFLGEIPITPENSLAYVEAMHVILVGFAAFCLLGLCSTLLVPRDYAPSPEPPDVPPGPSAAP